MAPGILSALALAGLTLGMYVRHNFRSRGAITARRPRVSAFVILALPHPSQQETYLPCSLPPDCAFCARPHRPARRIVSSGSNTHRALVITCACFNTMACHSQDAHEDEITESEDIAGDITFGGASLRGTMQVTPQSMSDDLHAALAMPTTFGSKLFEINMLLAVATTCKVNVKDTGDLLLLRDWLFEELPPPLHVDCHVIRWRMGTFDCRSKGPASYEA
jgi:hypothetical protein